MASYVGAVFSGELDYNGKWTGQGELSYPDGTKYIGHFRDGMYHGEGMIIFKSGSKHSAVWREGIEVESTASYQWADGLAFNIGPYGGATTTSSSSPSSSSPKRTGGPGSRAVNNNDDEVWPYIVPFDRRMWSEHKEGKRANIPYQQGKKKINTNMTILPL